MAEKKMQYIDRNYQECRNSIIDITNKYYPDVFGNINDASIGNWLINIMADIYDNLNFHIDRTFQETSIDSASQLSSVRNIARTKGLRIPGRKAALCEVEISCELPMQYTNDNGEIKIPDENYCPYIRRGTLFSTGSVVFELMNDIDFREQFNHDGYSDRQIIPNKNSNNDIVNYTYKKLAIVAAGQSKVYKKVITGSDIKPFMEITLQDRNILGVESIIVKQGVNLGSDPLIAEFKVDDEEYYDRSNKPVKRFFEVENLIDQYRFGYEMSQNTDGGTPKSSSDEYKGNREIDDYYNPIWSDIMVDYKDSETNTIVSVPVRQVVRGKWKRLKNKFITEYTDDWYLKIIFGAGIANEYGEIPDDAQEFTKYMMSRMYANDYMGVLPEKDSTIYVLYRVGGGEMSNIGKDTLNNIIYLNMDIKGNCLDTQDTSKRRRVRNSIRVTNTTPSYGGKDEPSEEEIKYMIKYNSGAQNRCVTINDYYAILAQMPAMYGSPFRVGIIEENNKISIYTLGLDEMGHLTSNLAETVADNMKEYLKQYKNVNDMIEIKSGKIINLSFSLNVFIDKTYDKAEVSKRIIETVYDYMDIKRHQMGEDIFLGDLNKEISKLDGVLNLIKMRVYNKIGDGYSDNEISQQLINVPDCCYSEYDEALENYDNQIDLVASDMLLIGEVNSMFEVKNITDITVNVKTR